MLDSLLRNRTVVSVVLRTLGYVPGPQLPLEFGGNIEDFTVAGAKLDGIGPLLDAEIAAAGPIPRSVRDQRILARRAARKGAKPHKVDWHASPVAGLLPGRQARPPTPKARAKRRKKHLLGEVELGGQLVGLQNMTLISAPAGKSARNQLMLKKKRRTKTLPRGVSRRNATAPKHVHRQRKPQRAAAAATSLRMPRNASRTRTAPRRGALSKRKRPAGAKHPRSRKPVDKDGTREAASVDAEKPPAVSSVALTTSRRRKQPRMKPLKKRRNSPRLPAGDDATSDQKGAGGDTEARPSSSGKARRKPLRKKSKGKAKKRSAEGAETPEIAPSAPTVKAVKNRKTKDAGKPKRRRARTPAPADEGDDSTTAAARKAARRARLRGVTMADRSKGGDA